MDPGIMQLSRANNPACGCPHTSEIGKSQAEMMTLPAALLESDSFPDMTGVSNLSVTQRYVVFGSVIWHCSAQILEYVTGSTPGAPRFD